MEDGHFIDDPLVVVSIKPDFSGMGLKKKPNGVPSSKDSIKIIKEL